MAIGQIHNLFLQADITSPPLSFLISRFCSSLTVMTNQSFLFILSLSVHFHEAIKWSWEQPKQNWETDLYELHLSAHFSEIHVVLSEKQASIFLANANIWIEISDVCTSLWKWASDFSL